jgi:hypothetical protein
MIAFLKNARSRIRDGRYFAKKTNIDRLIFLLCSHHTTKALAAKKLQAPTNKHTFERNFYIRLFIIEKR